MADGDRRLKLPDEMVIRARDALGAWVTQTLDSGEPFECAVGARVALEVALSEGGTTQRFCLYHGATAVSDSEVTRCRIADRSNPKAADWCKVVEVMVIPLESKE